MKKLLYLEDLYSFYVSQNKNVKFSSKDNDTTIVVHIDEPFTYDKNEENDLILNTPIRLCHTQKNINQSYISEKAMKDAIPTAYNMPILGYIFKDEESEEYKFAGHEFFINEDNEVEYEEIPVGCIPESAGLELVYDEDMDKTYLDGNGIIWRTYSKAADILEREKKLSCSVELVVDELSFDSKEKVLVIDKFRFSGVTILQVDRETGEEIKPGMVGANISIADFSEKNNSVFSNNDKVIELLSALNEKIDNLNINDEILKEGGKTESMKKEFNEEAEVNDAEVKDTPSANFDDNDGDGGDGGNGGEPDVTDYYDDPDDTDGGNTDGNDDPDPTPDPDPEPEPEPEPDPDPTPEPDPDPTPEPEPEPEPEPSGDDDSAEAKKKRNDYSIDYTVNVNGETKTFAVSLKDKLFALTTLVNDTYSESDGAWYDVDVYEETKTVVAHDYWNNKHFRQNYSVKKDVYSLKGDRTEVFVQYLSSDEIAKLDDMKANYSSITKELESFKAEPKKEAILNKECYAQIAEEKAFKKLADKETHFSMSVDEVQAEADRILLEYAKGNKIEFSSKDEEPKKKVGMKIFASTKEKKKSSRYGNLF